MARKMAPENMARYQNEKQANRERLIRELATKAAEAHPGSIWAEMIDEMGGRTALVEFSPFVYDSEGRITTERQWEDGFAVWAPGTDGLRQLKGVIRSDFSWKSATSIAQVREAC